jgi:hypothetical protein
MRFPWVRCQACSSPQVEMQRMLTLFERLNANGMAIAPPIQGIMLLNTLLSKWDRIGMIYLQGQNVLANVTFAAVRDAIMADFEQTSRPSTLAVQKISVVKHKGKSPQFMEQSSTKSPVPPKASGSAPSGDAPKKKRRGGKKAKAHAIVSSALVPDSVLKRMQESHHVVPTMAAPAPAPQRPFTVVGGPSRAPINVPATVASFNSSSVSYQKVNAIPAQAFTGQPSQPGPHALTRIQGNAWQRSGLTPEGEQQIAAPNPVTNPTPAEMQEAKRRAKAIREQAKAANQAAEAESLARRLACSSIVENAVASSSKVTVEDQPVIRLKMKLMVYM